MIDEEDGGIMSGWNVLSRARQEFVKIGKILYANTSNFWNFEIFDEIMVYNRLYTMIDHKLLHNLRTIMFTIFFIKNFGPKF